MPTDPNLPLPPVPADPEEVKRIDHTRLRRRLLYGGWEPDARLRLYRLLGSIRTEAVGDPDLSANSFRAICQGAAALFDRAGRDLHPGGATPAEYMRALRRRAGFWPMMQRFQRDALGLREMFLRVDVDHTEAGTVVKYRPVFPDLVEATPDPEDPERPICIREARPWTPAGSKQRIWVWEVWSIEDPDRPFHRVLTAHGGEHGPAGSDISHLCGLPDGGLVGETYQRQRFTDGRPFLPYVTYHAARTGCLFDPYEGIEVVEGTLQVAVKWTLYGHFLRNASWAQRWVIDAQPAGASVEGTTGNERSALATDASFVMQLERMNESGQPAAGQWNVTVDPVHFAESIALYERRLAAFAGIDPSDIQRVSGDPRSGYALAISRDGKRESQRRYGPIFETSDAETLCITAALVNRAVGKNVLPETDWEIEYQALPPSPEEQRAEREQLDWEEAQGLLTPVQKLLRLNPTMDQAEAERLYLATRLEKLLLEQRVKEAAIAAGLAPAAPPRPAAPAAPAPPKKDPEQEDETDG